MDCEERNGSELCLVSDFNISSAEPLVLLIGLPSLRIHFKGHPGYMIVPKMEVVEMF
jgi:hypothetical protein